MNPTEKIIPRLPPGFIVDGLADYFKKEDELASIKRKILDIQDTLLTAIDRKKCSLNVQFKGSIEPHCEAYIYGFDMAFEFNDAWDWAVDLGFCKYLTELKNLFEEYLSLCGASEETLTFVRRPLIFEDNGNEWRLSPQADLVFVDGFIMEGKSDYVAKARFTGQDNVFIEPDFIYRDIFTKGPKAGQCMLDNLDLMGMFHLVMSKITPIEGFNPEKGCLIDRTPFSCCVFDDLDLNYVYLDFTAWLLLYGRRCAKSMKLKVFVNQCILDPLPHRKHEQKIYKNRHDMLKCMLSYYVCFFLFLDLATNPELASKLICVGKIDNRFFKNFNALFDYLSFIMPSFDDSIIIKKTKPWATKSRIQWIRNLIDNNFTFFLGNEEYRRTDMEIDIKALEQMAFFFAGTNDDEIDNKPFYNEAVKEI